MTDDVPGRLVVSLPDGAATLAGSVVWVLSQVLERDDVGAGIPLLRYARDRLREAADDFEADLARQRRQGAGVVSVPPQGLALVPRHGVDDEPDAVPVWVCTAKAAELYGVSTRTMQRLIGRSVFPARRRGLRAFEVHVPSLLAHAAAVRRNAA